MTRGTDAPFTTFNAVRTELGLPAVWYGRPPRSPTSGSLRSRAIQSDVAFAYPLASARQQTTSIDSRVAEIGGRSREARQRLLEENPRSRMLPGFYVRVRHPALPGYFAWLDDAPLSAAIPVLPPRRCRLPPEVDRDRHKNRHRHPVQERRRVLPLASLSKPPPSATSPRTSSIRYADICTKVPGGGVTALSGSSNRRSLRFGRRIA